MTKCRTPSPAIQAVALAGHCENRPRSPVSHALLSANDMAERSARMAPSTGDSAFLFPPGFGLPGEEIPQPLAHRVGGLRRPFAEALAGAHAELAGCDLVLDELRRFSRAVEVGEQHVLDVEGEIDSDEV